VKLYVVLSVFQSDIDFLSDVDDNGDFESHHDEPEAESIKKSEVCI